MQRPRKPGDSWHAPANASSAALLTFDFIGRIDGREPASFDLSQAISKQIHLMSQDDLSTAGKRYGKELAARATDMSEAGESLIDQKK